jgi:hypothetical protein
MLKRNFPAKMASKVEAVAKLQGVKYSLEPKIGSSLTFMCLKNLRKYVSELSSA